MISSIQKNVLFKKIVELLELPDAAYEKAIERYQDIGTYLGREKSSCHNNDPHIFPQGSFRLGTAVRPLNDNEEYDLDLACNLTKGISQETHSQANLKQLIGNELESYRKARNINAPLDAKHRCWCLEYEDHLSFHMDIVPCIPADDFRRISLKESMVASGQSRRLSEEISCCAVAITDDRHPQFNQISHGWDISNPEGYAKWFESRMQGESRILFGKAQIDDFPLYKRKSPLQRAIQLLKRHRDQMFKSDQVVKPISVIITTIAAKAYSGQTSIERTLQEILNELKRFDESGSTLVPNPVNLEENFADKWSKPEYVHLNLRNNFSKWVMQARADFKSLVSSADVNVIAEQVVLKLSVQQTPNEFADLLGMSVAPSIHLVKTHEISKTPIKPWRRS